MAFIGAFNSYLDDTIASGADVLADLNRIKTEVNGNIQSVNLATDAVTSDKILNAAVTAPKLANDSVVTSKIADGNVTTSKIADNAVTNAKVGTGALQGSVIATSSLEFGDGSDGTKAGQVKGIYIDFTFNLDAGLDHDITHNLGTMAITGVIDMCVGTSSGVLYDLTVVDPNTIRIKNSKDHDPTTGTKKLLILYNG